ncbi:hypothetical protein KC340_g4357 [Hortaea werneckii]|nr:hypothetical protein KC342_g4554 [Hortaea werneckii]KAI7106060.1 hypothetical protein KC339_g3386 [Hortaea werneckii]KAI7242303.1 hypothetical protein KC365_g3293 [Hortaea werneckii]KAI7330093.1 hypothetical protein KC340_g4357 [Hortaea werneckii]KAI7403157.1 hypothetical protein KC328_g2476 [Hortaea werneckii]
MSKVNESSNPERGSSPNSSSGRAFPERIATAEVAEPVPRQVKALPLRAKEPQTFRQMMAAETSDAKLYSNFAEMYYYRSERLRDLYRDKKYIECRQGCLQLLESSFVPHYKRIETLQLLSSVAGSALRAKRSLNEAQRRLDHLDNRKKSVQILLSENQILLETVKAHMTADDTEEDDTKDEDDDLVPRIGGDILLDNPPYFDWQASADAPAEATGIQSDDTIGFFAGRDAQERWESMIVREEVKDFYLVIEEENDEDDEEEDDDNSIEEESGDDPVEQEDDDDPIEEEREYDPIEEALAEKREKAE